jgi:hypothetical protein
VHQLLYIIMKKLLLIAAALVASTGVFAKKVKVQVDMTGQTVSSNGLHVVGNFKNVNYDGTDENPSQYNWDPANNAMSNGGNGNIYSVMLDIQGDLVYEFKFINDNDWAGAESIPAESQVGGGNGNRWVYIPAGTDTIELPAIKFGGNAPMGKYLLRLKVDMSLAGTVDAAGVHVAGSLQGWDPSKTKLVNYTGDGKYESTVYQTILFVDSGSYEYKFVNGDSWGKDESVPSECATNNNRGVLVDAMDVVKEIVCYAKCGVCKIVPKYDIVFNVDVESICDVDSVDVAGGLLDGSWGAGNKMTKVGSTNVWTGSQMGIDSGSTVQYKYRYYKAGVQNWEQIASPSGNRELKLTENTTLPANCINTFTNCAPRPAPQNITFKVDISEITPNGNQYLVVDFLGGKNAAIRMDQMPGNPAVYMHTLNAVCNGTLYYYFMNGDSSVDLNAEQFADTTDRDCTKPNGVGGFSRELVRTTATDLTLFYKFSSCKTSTNGLFDANVISANLRLYPNPTSTYTVIEFNDNANSHNVQVMDIAGRVIRTYSNHKYNTLRIDKDELTPGIYFINVANDKNQTGSIKLLID